MHARPEPSIAEIISELNPNSHQTGPNLEPMDWEQYLRNYIRRAANQADASRLVLNLVDETKATFKFLVSISPSDHVLNLGPGKDNTTISLARSAGRVTVLDLDLAGLYLGMLKRQFYGLSNIDLLFGGAESHLPLSSHTFDVVAVQDSLMWSILISAGNGLDSGWSDQHQANWLPAFFKEIRRVLKPEGSVYFGLQPYLNADEAGAKLKQMTAWYGNSFRCAGIDDEILGKRIAAVADRHRFAAAIREAGFVRHEAYQISTLHGMPQRVTSLPPAHDSRGTNRLLSMVPGLFRKRISAKKGSHCGHAGFLNESLNSWIRGMVADLAQACKVPSNTIEIKASLISRKGKLVVILGSRPAIGQELVVKIPFHQTAQGMLANNYQTLEHLSETEFQLNSTPAHLAPFPACVHAGAYKDHVYFAEEGIAGRTWKDSSRMFSDKEVWRRTGKILDRLQQISSGTDTPEMTVSKYRLRLASIDLILESAQPRERNVWEAVKGRILDCLESYQGRLYFHKGDCSMHNVIIRSGRLPAMIDFDEAGWSPLKTVDLADLLFSYARTRKKIDRAEFIKIILREELDRIGLGFLLREVLKQLQADLSDLKESILLSWIDHVYFAIQFEPIKYRKYILKQAFTKTLAALEPLFARDGTLF